MLPKDALNAWNLRKAVSLALKGEDKWNLPEGSDPVSWLIAAGEREALEAAAVGTNAHQFAEDWMTGKNPRLEDLAKKEQGHARCFLDFVRDYQPEPVLVEKVLTYIDPKTGIPLYCGTMDLVAKLYWNPESDADRLPNYWEDGLTWLCDYKASSKEPRPSHALQSAAYRFATHWVDEETNELVEMPPVDKTAVVLLNGGGANRCYRMYNLDSSPVVFHVFKSLLTISNFTKVEDRVILGEM